ncbi:MAG TPA: hypothetical protein VLT45_06650, partial [Kofleriaceae bacterium]|nr:hypothetical protein [Kofleriaceae bacterium]
GDEIDGQRDIVAGIYRMGATDATAGQFASRAALDYFQWEALSRAENVYDPGMFEADPFDDEAVIAGLEHGDLYFAPIDAMEAFNLHGGSHAGAVSHVDDPSDLEFTSMPRGASLELDAKGQPARTRPSFSFREDWVWALPATTHASSTAYKLVQFMWRPEIHARECEALGMLPLQPDVVNERVSRFRLDWMSHVFDAGLEQVRQGEPTPPALIDKGIGSVYAQLWTTIVDGNVPATPDTAITAILHAPPAPKPLEVVAAAAPEHEAPAATPAEQTAPPPPPEQEDWETDVVLEGVGSNARGSGGRR